MTQKSDCLACHKTNEKFVAPAFKAIADRYQNVSISVIEKLSGKIQLGSSGTWGTVPMPAHPSISDEEARTLVKYILLTKYK